MPRSGMDRRCNRKYRSEISQQALKADHARFQMLWCSGYACALPPILSLCPSNGPLPLALPTQRSQHHQELPVESGWYNEPDMGQISLSHHPAPQYQYVHIRITAQPPALIKVTLCCDCLGYSPAFSSSSAPKTCSAGGYPSAQAQST